MPDNNKPAAELRDGALKVTIWKNRNDDRDYYSMTLTRSYKDDNDEWKETTSFNSNESLRMASLLQQAHLRVLELKAEK